MKDTATQAGHPVQAQVTAREILHLAVPALGALLAEPLFLLADTAIVSHLGTGPFAGLGTAAAALATLVNICVFLAYGTSVAVARRLGAGDTPGAVRTGIDGLAIAAGLGFLLAAIGLLTAPWTVRALGVTPAAAAGYAVTYLKISAFGLPPMLVVLAATGLLRGLADTRTPLLIAAAGALANLDALAIAAQTLVGRARGSGDPARAGQLLRRLTRWGSGYGLLTGLVLLAAAPLALRLLAPDPHVRAALIVRRRLHALGQRPGPHDRHVLSAAGPTSRP
jgi:Na+-driven multidrug efflux pump